MLGADTTAAVTAITATSQVVVSLSAGEGEPSPPGSSVPLSHSMCKHVVISGEPYVVDDATLEPAHALAVRDFGVGAYVGFPLRGTKGTVLGAVCAATPGPRQWTAQELCTMGALATAAEAVVAMHTAARSERVARISGVVPTDPSERVLHDLRTPLTSLLGFLESLLDDAEAGGFNEAQRDALRRSHANAERLRSAVDYLDHPAAISVAPQPQRRVVVAAADRTASTLLNT